jgi:thiosulfate reductase cytochrome b subunit
MIYHYQGYIRLWHLFNALFFLVLILTGLSMQYSNPDSAMIPFALSVKLHNICGIGLTANYLIFFIGNIISGNRKHYKLQWKGLQKKLIRQIRYYIWGYLNKEKTPHPLSEEIKFNPLQAFTYAIAMYIGVPVLFISGWGLLFPEAILHKVFGGRGLLATDLVHVITGFILSVFMVIHIYTISIGKSPKSNYRAILTGWAEVEKEH